MKDNLFWAREENLLSFVSSFFYFSGLDFSSSSYDMQEIVWVGHIFTHPLNRCFQGYLHTMHDENIIYIECK